MKSPKQLLTTVLQPIYQIYNKTISREARHKGYQGVANFIFDHCKETALILLIFNSISIIASHFAQIGGLRRSKRENKDYLINQERKELGLDLLLTIIPPFIINNALTKKLDSGEWTTESARRSLIKTITQAGGVAQEELYNTDDIVPVRETIGNLVNTVLKRIAKIEKLPKKCKTFVENNIKPDPINVRVPSVSMEELLIECDAKYKNTPLFDKFYNKSAYDDIQGSRNGMLIMATLGYTIIATAVVMPILKNILSNHTYKKQLEKMGETKESLKRKQRYAQLQITNMSVDNFINENTNTVIKPKQPYSDNSVFDQFNTYGNSVFNTFGPRI